VQPSSSIRSVIGDALQTVIDRGDFIPSLGRRTDGQACGGPALETDPVIVDELIARAGLLSALEHDIRKNRIQCRLHCEIIQSNGLVDPAKPAGCHGWDGGRPG
jgi:hypothetical protein